MDVVEARCELLEMLKRNPDWFTDRETEAIEVACVALGEVEKYITLGPNADKP